MLPKFNDDLISNFEEVVEPSKNYKMVGKNRCVGFVDGLEAVKQAIFLILSVERYEHIIYSWNYGVEFNDLFGKPTSFVLSEIKRRIKEALVQDDRINSVDNFEFEVNKNKVYVTFTVHSIFGDFEGERTVSY